MRPKTKKTLLSISALVREFGVILKTTKLANRKVDKKYSHRIIAPAPPASVAPLSVPT